MNGSNYASKPVYLYRVVNGQWALYKGSTAANGCGTWRDVVANGTYYV